MFHFYLQKLFQLSYVFRLFLLINTLNFFLEILGQVFIIFYNIFPASPKNSHIIFKFFFNWIKYNFCKLLWSIIKFTLYFNFFLKLMLIMIRIFDELQSFILFGLLIYFHSIQQNVLSLPDFFKKGDFIFEILHVQQWALVIVS